MKPEDVHFVMGSASGRSFVLSVLRHLGFLAPQIYAEAEQHTIVNAGTVGKANSLFNQLLEAQPEQTLLMIREDLEE